MMLWSVITLAAYLAALWLYRRSGHHLLCLPVLTGTGLVLAALALAGTGYPVYAEATRVLRWLSGPAVIALAVPLYRQAALLRRLAVPLLAALAAGLAQIRRVGETPAVAMCGLLSLAMVSQLSIKTCLLAASSVGSVSISWRRFKKARHSGLSSRDPTSFVVF